MNTVHIVSLTFAILAVFGTSTAADHQPTPAPAAPGGWVVECVEHPDGDNKTISGATNFTDQRIEVFVCDRPEAGRQVTLHELGHAWADENLDSEEAWAWMVRRGTHKWNPTDPYDFWAFEEPWIQRPAEEFADAYRWCHGGVWHRVGQMLPTPSRSDCAWMRRALQD